MRKSFFILVPLLLIVACGREPQAPAALASTDYSLVSASAATASEIAQLRQLVAPFHDFDAARAAGWSVQITPCLEAPGLGAMGFHYGKLAFIGDGGTVELLQPELLLYEPLKNGSLRFVGVEYIVPFADHPATEAPPTLLRQEFAQVPAFGVWGLHIWVGRENRSGIFSPWNPKVSCEHAGLQGVTAGHSHGR